MKFPICRQLDSRDCGPACIVMISKYYKKEISIEEVRDKSYINRTGVSLLGLIEAAHSLGFEAQAKKISFDDLINIRNIPCILHWNNNHFVVLYKIKKSKYYIVDPAFGKITCLENEVLNSWANNKDRKGIVMIVRPLGNFEQKKNTKLPSLFFMYKYIKNYKALFVHLIMGLLVGGILQLFFPFLTQLIVDNGIRYKSVDLIKIILLAQIMLIVSRNVIEVIRRYILLHISARMNLSLLSDFLVKMMRLSMRFFDNKLIGDLIRRIEDHKRIETFLTQSVVNLFFSLITIIVFSVVLVVYDIKIFAIFLICSLIYIIWIKLFLKRRAELDHKNFSQMSENQNSLLQLIYGMQEIKLTGCEQQKMEEWECIQTELFQTKKKSLALNLWLQTGAVLINEVKNIFITITSSIAVINGEITLGGMLSVQYIIGQMHGPIEHFVLFIQQAQDARLSLDRMREIHDSKEDGNEFSGIYDVPSKADIEINNIVFSYGHIRIEPVINNLSLFIPRNKTTAIVGLSGSGKTTLIKLLLGFYYPQKGSIRIGSVCFDKISLKEWRSRCGVVMQDGYIFNDTILKNIAPCDNEIDMDKIDHAIQMSNLCDYIATLPQKINTKIGNTGRGLSQGQKQRLLIARAIYKDPDYIFFDEATNALDSENESIIMKNLDLFFKDKTVVVVAHRLSTVKNADQIVVMKKGNIAEIGNHDVLIRNRGIYYNLVKEQLTLDC